jgi:hypothetical protein
MDAMRLSSNITSLDQKEIDYNAIENFDVERPWENFVRLLSEKTKR